MLRFLVRRVARGCCVLFLVSVLCFCAFEIAPGDFFVEARVSSTISPEAIDRLREQHGLTRSLPVKYVYWAASVVRGEWGESLMYGTPVWPILWTRAKNTLILSVTAMSAAWIIAIPLCLRAGTGSTRMHGLVFGFAAFFNAIPEILIVVLCLMCALRGGLLHLGVITPLPATGSIWESAGGLIARSSPA